MSNQIKHRAKLLLLLFKMILSLGLISFFIWKLSAQAGGLGPMAEKLLQTLRHAKPLTLLLAMSLHPVGMALISWRWSILLSPFGKPPRYARLYRLYFMATFFNNFTFGTVGGDALRAMAGKRFSDSLTRSATVVMIEHLTGFVALFLIGFVGLTVQLLLGQASGLLFALGLAGLLMLALGLTWLLSTRITALPTTWEKRLPARLVGPLNRLLETLAVYRSKPGALLKGLAVSLLFQTMMVFYYYLICRAMGADLPLAQALIGIPVLIIMLMVIPAINGLGVRTTGFGSLLGMSTAHALSGEGVDILFRLFFGLIGGVLFLTDRSQKENRPH
jgi:uncharacterized protein (TIRG00374 family)